MAAKSKALMAFAVIAIIGGGWLARDVTPGGGSSDPSEAGRSSARDVGDGSSASRDRVAADQTRSLPDGYGCKNGAAACETDVLAAKSVEEAQWLRGRGYPSRDQINTGRNFSVEQLRLQALGSGALVDTNLYAQGLLREQRHREALGVLLDSFSAEGNLYALHLVSDVYMNSQEMKNLPLAMAYLRLAYLSGDSKAGTVLTMRFPGAAPPELAYADRRAAELRAQLSPGGNWPRP